MNPSVEIPSRLLPYVGVLSSRSTCRFCLPKLDTFCGGGYREESLSLISAISEIFWVLRMEHENGEEYYLTKIIRSLPASGGTSVKTPRIRSLPGSGGPSVKTPSSRTQIASQ